MATTSMVKNMGASVTAELSTLYEISSLRFSGSEESFAREVVEKAASLFGVRRMALFMGNGGDRRLIASLACRNEMDISILIEQNQLNKGKLVLGADGSIGTLYFEQEKPIGNRQWRLYNILAQQLEHNLQLAHEAAERKRMEEELRQSEEFNSGVLHNSPNPVLVANPDASIRYVNPALEELTGFTPAELVGQKPPYPWWPEEMQERIENKRRVAFRRGFKEQEELFKKKNGEKFWVNVSGTPIMIGGKFKYYLANWVDITERKRIEEELIRNRDYLERLNDSITDMVYDIKLPERTIQYINKSVEMVLGYSPEECIGKNVEMLYFSRSDYDEAGRRVREGIKRGEQYITAERKMRRKDGKGIFVEIRTNFLREDGKAITALSTVRDITERKRMEEELRQSEARLAHLYEEAPVGYHELDYKGRITRINRTELGMLGYTAEEMLGRHVWDFIVEQGTSSQAFAAKMAGTRPPNQTFERTYRRKDGTTFPVLIKDGALRDESGQIIGLRSTIQDITERRKAEAALRESEEKLNAIVQSVGDNIQMMDKDCNILWTNQSTRNAFGEDIIGRKCYEVFHRKKERCQPFPCPTFQALQDGKIHEFDSQTISKDGQLVYRHVVASVALRDEKGKPQTVVECSRDVTESKRMERDLQEKNEQLDAQNEELQAQTEELQTAYKQLQELDKIKDNFLSTVSHELRTPLTSIKGFAEILLSYEEDRETQQEFLAIINDESERLTRLIDDLLDLARLESGRQQWVTDRIAITDIIPQAVHAVHSLVTQKRLNIQTDLAPGLPAYMADKDRLIQVVTNLLSNAIKFTPEEGEIKVKAELVKDAHLKKPVEAIRVSVSDTGIGIDAKDQKAIFERFKQAGDTMTDKPKGTGLGLPICKEIVEHYGGRMWVESEPGKGSTFYFTLPLDKKVKAVITEPEEKRKDVTPKVGRTILVVDDEDHVRRFLSHEFTKRGYRVLEATNGHEAISLARKQLPDLITLDVLIPEIDGYDVTAILKNDAETRDIPILIISVVEDKQKAFHLGANDYLTKPFKIGMVMEKISKLLRKAQKTVLVVDDDKALVKSLKYKLEKRGISTYVAYNGKEALQVVHQTPPNLILLDIIMPEMDGYEVMSRLKRNRKTAPIPIIVLTGVEIDGGRVKAISLGADDYMTKSDGLDALFENIETYINVH